MDTEVKAEHFAGSEAKIGVTCPTCKAIGTLVRQVIIVDRYGDKIQGYTVKCSECGSEGTIFC